MTRTTAAVTAVEQPAFGLCTAAQYRASGICSPVVLSVDSSPGRLVLAYAHL
jgi:hypothetical protein